VITERAFSAPRGWLAAWRTPVATTLATLPAAPTTSNANRQLGTPLDPSKLAKTYMRPALKHAGISKPFRPFHDLRHTALTHEAAAGNPHAYIQLKAGHAQGTITERYIHAAQVLFPGAAARGEERIFAAVESR
jgi:integrase